MATNKVVLVIVLAACLMVLAPGYSLPVQAHPAWQEQGRTVDYQGRLNAASGQPVADGGYDLTFRLYAVQEDGQVVWSETHPGVAVRGGVFTVELGSVKPLPEAVLNGSASWLEVAVRGPGEADYTTLKPRRQLNALTKGGSSESAENPSSKLWMPAVSGNQTTITTGKYGGYFTISGCATPCAVDLWGGMWVGYGPGIRAWSLSLGGTQSIGVWGLSGSGSHNWYPPQVGLNYGVYGSGDSYGVYGTGSVGVQGTSLTGQGVVGYSFAGNGNGVWGTGATGVEADGNDSSYDDNLGDLRLGGGIGEILTGGNMDFESNNDVYIDLDQNNNGNNRLNIYNGGDAQVFTVDESGNVIASGTIHANGGITTKALTKDYGERLLNGVASPVAQLEDFGSAVLSNGQVTVAIDPIFAETVNLNQDYQVLTTPSCSEPAILYVSAKGPTSFTVRGVSLSGQPSSCAFDYRIAAKQLGRETVRLQQLDQSQLGSLRKERGALDQ